MKLYVISEEYSLIIKKKARKKDIERILNLCEKLNEQYVVEKAEGLLLFDALLDQFEKALPHQLEVHETAEALAKQGLFKPLMNEFLSNNTKVHIDLVDCEKVNRLLLN